MKISIIIPVLNEEKCIGLALEGVRDLKNTETVVCDGGSHDRTVEIAHKYAKVICSNPGRGIQMNAGAVEASGDILLFLHGDTLLPEDWHKIILSAMTDEKIVGGAFSLSIDSNKSYHKFIASAANLRTRLTRIPYGDQGIFVRKSLFEKIGGFKDIPIMEDVDFMQRLKKVGKVIILKDKVKTSARRWEKEGIFYTTLRNWILLMLYYLGVSPQKLYKFYKSIR